MSQTCGWVGRAALASVLGLLACRAPAPRGASAGRVATPAIRIAPDGGDVWGWTLRVNVMTEGGGARPCHLVEDGRRVELAAGGLAGGSSAIDGGPSAEISLSEGPHEVYAECAYGAGPPVRSTTVRYEERLPDVPRVRLVERAEPDGRVVLDASASQPSEGSRAPIVEYAWSFEAHGAQRATPRSGPTLTVDPRERVAVRLSVRDARGRAAEAAVWDPGEPVSAWLDRAVVYGVLPPLFGTPPLRAVTSSLRRLADLGVNVVWLTPIFAAAPGDFGYAVTDVLRVRRDYGDEADLSALVTEAHGLGMRVLLDLPMNDTSSLHPYFADASRLGAESRYSHFYARDRSGNFTHYFDWNNLPNLDYDDPEVDRWMIYSTARWLERFAIDGYRVDAAWGVRTRTPAFLAAWTRAMRDANPRALLLAEGSARDPFYLEHGFDLAYDWTDRVGQWAWQDLFEGPGVAARIARVLADPAYAAGGRTLRFLENNDTGARFVTRHGLGMSRVAAAFLLTSPGVPCLFTGQETGLAYEPYAPTAGTAPAPPSDATALTEWYRALIRLRRERPWLAQGRPRALDLRGSSEVVAYEITAGPASAGQEALLVVLNASDRAARVSIEVPGALGEGTAMKEAIGGGAFPIHHGTLDVELPAWGAKLLR